MENKKNELVGTIEARKNELTLEEANRKEAKLKEDIKSRLQQREAELSVLREQLNKAQLDADREKRRIEQARVLTPIAGLVSILENRAGGRGGFGQTTPTIREGDQIPAGMAVAQILDLSEMELVAKVEEVERANLLEGQEAVIYLDALPGKPVNGKIKTLGSTATTNVFRGEATKKFDTLLSLDMRQFLENVGASETQIKRILATARDNATRGVFGGGPARGLRALEQDLRGVAAAAAPLRRARQKLFLPGRAEPRPAHSLASGAVDSAATFRPSSASSFRRPCRKPSAAVTFRN